MRTKKRGRLRRHLNKIRREVRHEKEMELKRQQRKVSSFGDYMRTITGEKKKRLRK